MNGENPIGRRIFLGSACAAAASTLLPSGVEAAEEGASNIPPIPIVDTHVHFWDSKHLRYPWLDKSELLNRPYLPADYTQSIEGVNVERIVFVQAACIPEQALVEVDWVTELAKDDSRIQGIVGSAPLELGDAVLPILQFMAKNPLVKGIRRYVAGETDIEFILQPGFVRGVLHLASVGFTCDLGVRREQLPAATELARRCPGVRFMLNHIGVPDIKNHQLDPWREHLRTMAALPNVSCKLSGVATAADHDNWTPEDLRPAIDHVIDCFGFDRTAFGSDWPVMLQATTYPRWIETVGQLTRGCSERELRLLFRGTAERVYDLNVRG